MKTIHMGDVQNSLVRFILWRIGKEPIPDNYLQAARQSAKKYFDHKCAYCGEEKELIFDHAVPINRTDLGQHCIGNLIPSCHECNGPRRKGKQDFQVYLRGEPYGEQKAEKILGYMASQNYVPLGDNKRAKKLIEAARKEVADLADKYIGAINEVFGDIASSTRSKASVAIDKAPTPINGSPHRLSPLEKIKAIKERMNRSYSNLRKGCLDQMGISSRHGTPNVRASSRAFAKSSEATDLNYAEIVALLDEHSLDLER